MTAREVMIMAATCARFAGVCLFGAALWTGRGEYQPLVLVLVGIGVFVAVGLGSLEWTIMAQEVFEGVPAFQSNRWW